MTGAETMEKAEPSVVSYWRISGIFTGLVIFGGVALQGLLVALSDSPKIGFGIFGGAMGLGALQVGWTLLTTRLRYRRLAFSVAGGHLRVRHGVLVHREKTIPIARLTHLDVDRGPFERLFGLSSLSIFTAGGRAATFRLPGLRPERAEEIRKEVLARAAADNDDTR
jgi:hypothetical protein